jgi:hypothetical protein
MVLFFEKKLILKAKSGCSLLLTATIVLTTSDGQLKNEYNFTYKNNAYLEDANGVYG